MSAYIPASAHIDALVRLAYHGPTDRAPAYPGDGWGAGFGIDEFDRIGQMLVDEVVASVSYRYPNDAPTELPGPVDHYYLSPYQYTEGRRLTIMEGLVAIAGYEYQACEHEAWVNSEAREFCLALKDRLIHAMPGWDTADTWSIS